MRFLAGVILVVALASAGCGGGSSSPTNSNGNGEAAKPAKQVLTDAVKAANAATSVHMSGYTSDAVHKSGLDFTIEKGKGAIGSFTFEGQKVDLVNIGGANHVQPCPQCKNYVRASSAFWASFGPVAGITTSPKQLAGKWVEFPTSNIQAMSAFQGFVELADVQAILGILASNMGPMTKESTTYKGQSVVALYGPGKIRRVYVASSGKPYPVLVANTNSANPASVSFDNWGKPVSLTAPSGAVDASKLSG